MTNIFEQYDETTKWRAMVRAAKNALADTGYKTSRIPGRGLSNVWNVEKKGKTATAAIRTTRDRYLAFPPLQQGKLFKTLSDVELVVVATVDSKDDPKKVLVYLFPAEEVKKRFDANLAARKKAGQPPRDNFGMWVALDPDSRGLPTSVGSGILVHFKPIAEYDLAQLLSMERAETVLTISDEEVEVPPEESPNTIAEVMAQTRERVASILNVRLEAVKLDLKIEY